MKAQNGIIMIAITLILILVFSLPFSTFSFAVKTNSSSSSRDSSHNSTTTTASRTEPKLIPNESTNSKASIISAQHNTTTTTTTTLQSGSSKCTPSEKNQVDFLWTHVYTPSRLTQKIACITVSGVVHDDPKAEADGDKHFVLELDPNQPKLSMPSNCKVKVPVCNFIIVEIICHGTIDKARTTAIDACYKSGDNPPYRSGITAPAYNKHITITGRYVLDSFGGRNWGEIHPVAFIKVLTTPPPPGATKQSNTPVEGEE